MRPLLSTLYLYHMQLYCMFVLDEVQSMDIGTEV